jgi:hypothetical protein
MSEPGDPRPNDAALLEAQRIARDAAGHPAPPPVYGMRRRIRLWHIVLINLIALALFIVALKMHQ